MSDANPPATPRTRSKMGSQAPTPVTTQPSQPATGTLIPTPTNPGQPITPRLALPSSTILSSSPGNSAMPLPALQTSARYARCGYLWKKRNFPLRGWQKRWFVIEQDLLHYFKKKPDERSAKRRRNYLHLFLPMVEVVPREDGHTFKLMSGSKLIIELKSKEKDDAIAWMAAIKEVQSRRETYDSLLESSMPLHVPLTNPMDSEAPDAVRFLNIQHQLDQCILLEKKLHDSLEVLANRLDTPLSSGDKKEKKKKKKTSDGIEETLAYDIVRDGAEVHRFGQGLLSGLSVALNQIIEMEDLIVRGLNAEHSTANPGQLVDSSLISNPDSHPSKGKESISNTEVRRLRSLSIATDTGTEGYYDANTHVSFSGSDDSESDTSDSEPDSDEYFDDDDRSEVTGKKSFATASSASSHPPPRIVVGESRARLPLIRAAQSKSSVYRTRLPAAVPENSPGLLDFLYENSGKDLSKLQLPVSLNEPISYLQNMCEDLEYSSLLSAAASCPVAWHRMVYISAFAISSLASTVDRGSRKPFKPFLGETFEFIPEDKSFRFLAEHVIHSPALSVCTATSEQWIYHRELHVKNKMQDSNMDVFQIGGIQIRIPKYNEVFSYSKVQTNIARVTRGQTHVEHTGEFVIKNETTGDICTIAMKHKAGSLHPSKREFHGRINFTESGAAQHVKIQGAWDSHLQVHHPDGHIDRVWEATPSPVHGHELVPYGFTPFACSLNQLSPELQSSLPPTDSRFRRDIRMLENGDIEAAGTEKSRLEDENRQCRKSKAHDSLFPLWFKEGLDEGGRFAFKNTYWDAKARHQFGDIPQLFK